MNVIGIAASIPRVLSVVIALNLGVGVAVTTDVGLGGDPACGVLSVGCHSRPVGCESSPTPVVGRRSGPTGCESEPVGCHSVPVSPVGHRSHPIGCHSEPVGCHSAPMPSLGRRSRPVGCESPPARGPCIVISLLHIHISVPPGCDRAGSRG